MLGAGYGGELRGLVRNGILERLPDQDSRWMEYQYLYYLTDLAVAELEKHPKLLDDGE